MHNGENVSDTLETLSVPFSELAQGSSHDLVSGVLANSSSSLLHARRKRVQIQTFEIVHLQSAGSPLPVQEFLKLIRL